MISTVLAAAAIAQAPNAAEITVYNQGFGLVKETRTMSLRQGIQNVAVEGVAALIETNSVGIKALPDPNAFTVLEQNYQYDLISPIAILNKAVGSRIRFVRVLPNGAKETLEGILVSSPTAMVGNESGGSQFTWNGMVIKTDDGRIVLNPTGEIEVSSIPEGLISKPTLLWMIEAAQAGQQRVELSYLTQGMLWNADYVLMLDEGGAKGGIKGWVTLTNNSGATWENAKLKLVAGDVNRVRQEMAQAAGRGGGGFGAADKGFVEESFFEYHLYTLQRPTTIRNKEIKQVSLLEAENVGITKRLIVDFHYGIGYEYRPDQGEIGSGTFNPQVRLEFVNSRENNMGMPLPQGRFKVYQRDSSGSVQMLGEDSIKHTPRNERVSLVVGKSFDIVAERKRTKFQVVSSNIWRETFEVDIRNRKEVADTVILMERHYWDWRVLSADHPHTKPSAQTLQFEVKLAPNEVKKITYEIETRWW